MITPPKRASILPSSRMAHDSACAGLGERR
jgi:hypothetical protein